ncbi:UNVERIFIED_CONTAM: hypothetical protein Sangu_0366300 [Sesamum angustifolium]|uniref:Uncharacterized protein n=1 Tax=Sesamum angustifolium TaxID=2727405 RepID=A0AAW2QR61_9LAMI
MVPAGSRGVTAAGCGGKGRGCGRIQAQGRAGDKSGWVSGAWGWGGGRRERDWEGGGRRQRGWGWVADATGPKGRWPVREGLGGGWPMCEGLGRGGRREGLGSGGCRWPVMGDYMYVYYLQK